MIQVIDQQGNFYVSLFFIVIMVIGNFMLLNLFLAILLKSISEIGDGDGDGEEEKKEGDGEEKEDEEGADEEMNDSGGLNSSNSNIEEEFE